MKMNQRTEQYHSTGHTLTHCWLPKQSRKSKPHTQRAQRTNKQAEYQRTTQEDSVSSSYICGQGPWIHLQRDEGTALYLKFRE